MNYLHTKPPKCISNVATVAKQKVQMRFGFHCEAERIRCRSSDINGYILWWLSQVKLVLSPIDFGQSIAFALVSVLYMV